MTNKNVLVRMGLLPLLLCTLLIVSACFGDTTPRVLQQATPQPAPGEVEADATQPAGVEIQEVIVDEENAGATTAQPLDEAQLEVADEQAEPLNLAAVMVQASFLLNRDVANAAGDSIATVNDLVVDAESGRILYVMLTYGGLLGLGEEARALPLSAFAWGSDLRMTLTVADDLLDDLPVVDSDWPATADATWNDQVGAFWTDQGVGEEMANAIPLRLGTMFGLLAGEMGGLLGPIEDFLIDLAQGEVRYMAVFADPSFYTIDTLVLLPFSMLDMVEMEGERLAVVHTPSEVFIMAPTIDRALFQTVDFIDQPFIEEIDARWQELGQ